MKTAVIISYFWLMVAIVCAILVFSSGLHFAFPAIVSYLIHRLIMDAVVRIEGEE